ncbi:hypothetical protein V6N13_143452 [Hibiscus sabdariffa]|uniref:RNase H type-1 domain-containing protein n=1 Tax=Hibiscus sabdariffa TaxID=183260 RepID=A0ABR2FHN8_9ROSI
MHCRLFLLAIWGHRNKVVHEQAGFDLPSFIIFIKSYLHDMDSVRLMASSPAIPMSERWSPPSTGLVKVNFDVSFDSSTSSSFSGIIIRDNEGEVLTAGCFSHSHVLDPFAAEALACHQALMLAHGLSFRRIVVEGDSLSVIKKVQTFCEDRSLIGMLIKDIKRKLKDFDSFTLLLCPRVCNESAHFIARLGRSSTTPCVWVENIPHHIEQIAIKDKWWTDPPDFTGTLL